MKTFLFPGLLLPFLLAPLPQEPKPFPPDEQGKFILKAGDYDLADLLDRSARFLGYVYLYPREITDKTQYPPSMMKIHVQKDLVLDREDCEDVISQFALTRGLVRTILDEERGIYEWVGDSTQSRRWVEVRAPWRSPEEILARPGLKEVVQTTIALKNMDPRQAASSLRPLYSNPGNFTQVVSMGNSNSLVLMGFRDLVAQGIRILQSADREGSGRTDWARKQILTLRNKVSVLEKRVQALEKGKAPAK